MLTDYGGWNIDVTTIYMMSVCKFSMVAFSYEDGEKDDEVIKSSHLIAKYKFL
jgi:lysophospholipid acyltransferase